MMWSRLLHAATPTTRPSKVDAHQQLRSRSAKLGTELPKTFNVLIKKGKGSPHSIAERRVPELIPVLGSQPAGDASHKPGDRLPLLSARPTSVTLATLKRPANNFAA